MIKLSDYTIRLNSAEPESLHKGLWIVILHANRIPPHIGLLFDGKYCSLNLKGIESDIDLPVLLRKIDMQQIESLFVKMIPHPVFSYNFLHEHFNTELSNFERVTAETTCFAPVKNFFKENYLLKHEDFRYIYQLFPVLYKEKMIAGAFGMNLRENSAFHFREYTSQDIENKLNEIEMQKA